MLGIILIGLLLRLFILSYRGSFWFDEAFSVHFASMNISQMLSYLRFENNPPLYFILLHFWMKIFGNAELTTRLLSMSFGLAAIPLIYLLGKRLHSTTAGLFAGFLTAISSFQVFYSTETRMYSLYVFLTLVVVWLVVRLYGVAQTFRSDVRAKALSYIFLFIGLLLLVWTHITAWLIVLALTLYLLWQHHFKFKPFLILHFKFLISVALAALIFLPWGLHFFTTKIIAPVSQGWVFFLPPSKNFFLDILQSFLAFGEDSAFIVTLLSAFIVLLLYYSLSPRAVRHGGVSEQHWERLQSSLWLAKEDPCSCERTSVWHTTPIFLLFWLLTPLLVGFTLNNGVLRYFIASAPALYLLLGIGFASLPKTKLPHWPIPFLFFFMIIPSYVWLTWYTHHQWNKLAEWIEQRETCNVKRETCNELVLVNPHSEILPLEHYYRGELEVKGFYPRDDTDDRDLRIVKTNWRAIVTKKNIPRLRDYTKDFERVFLVSGEIDLTSRNVVPLWFWEQGWKRTASKDFGRIGVILLERH